MMGHERPDGDAGLAGGQARRSIVHRLVKTVRRFASFRGELFEILAGFARRNHQRHRRGIRCNHEVLGQSPLQAQARHTKGTVLIIQAHVGPVVSRFGHTPGHPAQPAILNLLPDSPFAGLIQQGILIIRHDQQGHQVFKHRPAPRSQNRIAA